MSKWAPCKRRDFIRKLKKLGFDSPEPGGSHFYMRYGTFTFTLPNNAEYSVPQVKMLLREIEGESAPRSGTRDEGRPLGTGLQEQVPNHLKLLWSKVRVVSVKEKAWHRSMSGEVEGDERKRTTDEVSKTKGRRRNWGLSLLQEESRGSLLTAWVASGIKVA